MFRKELKKAFFSVPCLLMLLVTFAFYGTQMGDYLSDYKKIEPPQPGLESYGIMPSDDPAAIMPAALQSLYAEFVSGSYTAYPWGFVRYVRLGQEDQQEMAEILAELSGKTAEEIQKRAGTQAYQDGMVMMEEKDGGLTVSPMESTEENTLFPAQGVSYDRFAELMDRADSLLGGGSSYDAERLSGFGKREKTYEEAVAEYEAARDIDGFTGAHARLFADYMTILAAWLPAFLVVSECLRDRRAKVRELLWTRKVSSLRFTVCRCLCAALLSMAPILVLAGADTFRAVSLYAGEAVHTAAYFQYVLGWIFPTVLFSCAAGLFLTELTDAPVGLALILGYWILDLNRGMAQMDGGYGGLLLIPRHNNLLGAQTFADHSNALAADRLFYAALALTLLGLSALILERKRKGKWIKREGWKRLRKKEREGV